MTTHTEENYLKALFSLSEESGEITVARLSKKLRVKMPTVTSMMKKLAQRKFVLYTRYEPMRLTGKGRKAALLIIRKHRLVEMYLVKKMNFSWEEVHELAEQLEHLDAPKFFDRMDEVLGFPTIDPHGEPIPDKAGSLDSTTYQPLSTCKEGDTVRLRSVNDASTEFLIFLNNRGLRLGLKLRVRAVEPFEGSLVIRYGRRQAETLPHTVCDRLLVERV